LETDVIMKEQRRPNSDEQLSEMLKSWEVEDPLPGRFKEEVWRRIGREDRAQISIGQAISQWIRHLTQRPAWAVAYVVMVFAVGSVAGFANAERYRTNAEETWRAAYVESVSPVAQAATLK
jgi:hypothetical protein